MQKPEAAIRAAQKSVSFPQPERPLVAVQGVGFVGAAMCAALANARDENGEFVYNVVGVDCDDAAGRKKVDSIEHGASPVSTSDNALNDAILKGAGRGNLRATVDPAAYGHADVIVIDVGLDIALNTDPDARDTDYIIGLDGFRAAVEVVAQNANPNALILVETTVPPGTTDRIVKPVFEEAFRKRGLSMSDLAIAHSYERVMPGANYLASVTDMHRVFAGVDQQSGERARAFLETFINTDEYPLKELASTTASEMSKTLENSYRAMNIAFVQEWTEFADEAGVDLHDVISAIRVRPTHRNLMAPGLGVGGYCLTKDAFLADWSLRELFGAERHLKYSVDAIRTNNAMPQYTCVRMAECIADLDQRRVAILGVAYSVNVGDTRSTPTEPLYEFLKGSCADVCVHDPHVTTWREQGVSPLQTLDALADYAPDTLVLAVNHAIYDGISPQWVNTNLASVRTVVDCNGALSMDDIQAFQNNGVQVIGIGRGVSRDPAAS